MAKEPNLIPALKEGEILIIQRTVDDKNVFMFVTLTGDAFDRLTKNEIVLTATMNDWHESNFADGHVSRQRESIDRLLRHLQCHCMDNDCPYRTLAKDLCSRTDVHDPHTWYKRIRLGTPGIGPGSEQVKEIETHCPGHNPAV